MKRFGTVLVLIVLVGLAGSISAVAGNSASEDSAATARVGTFDSRAIAIAYYNSDAHMSHVKELKAEHAAAMKAGDAERASELQAEGENSQKLAHKQGFGTWPVDDILEQIKGEISRIADEAGVDVIVSKWDIVHASADLEFVDVTLAMVQPFNPDGATLKLIEEELPNVDPVPIQELEKHDH